MSRDPQRTNEAAPAPWLAIVGLEPSGLQALTAAARAAVAGAELVVGSARQLALVGPLVRGEVLTWPSPLAEGVARVLAARGRPTCVLASGDPFFYGIGATLAPSLVAGEFVCYPAPSSVSLAAARLGWPLQHTDLVSLHGRDLHAIIPYLQRGRRVIALSWDARTPPALCALLVGRGFGRSRVHVLEALGGPEERHLSASAEDFDARTKLADLNLVALELEAGPEAFAIPSRGSLPDGAFEHDGQLTKWEIRALTMSALAPRPGELLWDIGAGAGSVAVEWMLAHPACRAVAVERVPERCARIRRNASALGVPGLEVVEACAPEGLDTLPRPDAVFIGGGAGDRALLARCWEALPRGGRIVINAVSLETEALLLAHHAALGGELCRLSIERAGSLGAMTGWRPAMPVMQWRAVKSS